MPCTLTSLILDVEDIEISLRFYTEWLGIPLRRREVFGGHHLAYLSSGAMEMLLMQQPSATHPPAMDRTGGMVIKFSVSNLDAIAERLAGQRVDVLHGIERGANGELTFLVADPDGYAVLLTQRSTTAD